MRRVTNKLTNELVQDLRGQGFAITVNRKNHFIVRDPKGEFVTVLPSTPGDPRGRLNALASCRRHGFEDPRRQQRRAS